MSQKFCANCGNALSENEKFCAKCGTPAPADADPAPAADAASPIPETVNEPAFTAPVPPPAEVSPVPAEAAAKSGSGAFAKHKGAIIGCAVAAVAIIAVIVVLLCLPKYQKIDAKELFYISFNGINGNGTAVGYLNSEEVTMEKDYNRYRKLLKAAEEDEDSDDEDEDSDGYSKYFSDDKKELLKAYDKAKDKNAAADMKKALLKIKKEEYLLKLKFDKETDLSNGDTVKCTVEYDEDYLKENKIELENTEFEVEVSGLIEGKKLDLFEGFEVKFEGQNEEGRAVFEATNKDKPFILYSNSSSNYKLSNGDSFEVEASVSYSRVEDGVYLDKEDPSKGMYFKYNGEMYIVDKLNETKSFTVSGLKELEEIDVFKDIKFNTKGGVPYLRITSVDKEGCEDAVKDVYFTVETEKKYFQKGDTFKVKASTYSLKRAGYKAAGEVDEDGYVYKEYTIDDSFGTYITTSSTSADVDKLSERFDEFVKKFENQNTNRSSIGSVKFDGKTESFTYEPYADFVILPEGFEDGSISDSDPKNILFRVYKVTATVKKDDESSTKSFLVAFRFQGAYINAKGEGQLDSSYASYSAAESEKALREDFFSKDSKYGEAKQLGKAASSGDDSSKTDDDSSSDESSETGDDSSEDESSEEESSKEE